MHAASSDFPPPRALRVRWTVAVIAAATALFGLLVMIGWITRQPALYQWPGDLRAMQFNTALACILASIALGLWALRQVRFLVAPLGGVAALFGGITLAEYLTGSDYGIDQLFFASGVPTRVYAGRMSAISAVSLTLLGLGLIQLGLRRRWQRPWMIGALASIVISVAALALLGDYVGLPGTTHWGHFTRIAPHTAGGFVVLGVGLFLAAWQVSCRPGERTPRWLPIPMVLGVFTGALVLSVAVELQQSAALARTTHADSDSVQRQITQQFEIRASSVNRIAERWEQNGQPLQETWERDAALYTRDFPEMQSVEWIEPDGLIRWIVPRSGNEEKVGQDADRDARRAVAMERARREDRPIFSGAVELVRGGLGVIVYAPIQRPGGPFEGWIAGIFRGQDFLDRYLPREIAAGQSLRLSDLGQTFYTRSSSLLPPHADWAVRNRIRLPGAAWDLLVWPTPALAARIITPIPRVVLLVGIINALLLGGLCSFAQRHARSSRGHATAARALREALDEVKTLEGLLPICSCCKRVREDDGYWSQIDTYLRRHTDARLTHGYCPECAVKAFIDFGLDVPESIQAELAAHNFE